MKKSICIAIVVVSFLSLQAQEVMSSSFYNVLNDPQASNIDFEQMPSEVLETLNSEIFITQELRSEASILEIAFAKAVLTQPFPRSRVLYNQTDNRKQKMGAIDNGMSIAIYGKADDVYYICSEETYNDTLKFIKTH